MKPKSILLIEDEHALGSALSLLVRRMGHVPVLVASGKAGLHEFAKAQVDAAVIDIGLPDMSGLDVLEKIRESNDAMPVLVITAHATLQHAIDSQKIGATAYLNKPLDMEHLKQQLDAMLQPATRLAQAVSHSEQPDSATLIGAAPCLRDTFVGIARACAGRFPILIHGPSGSGKSLAAKLIHNQGAQQGGSCVQIASGSLDQWDPQGEWSGGSVVLDEISELSATLQSELADWINRADERAPRIMATLSVDPEQAHDQGLIKKELFYALRPAMIAMPSLRERSSDIPALCAFFAGIKGAGGQGREITPPVMDALQAHDWPGNVRELKHVLDVAMSMSQGGPMFLSHLPKSIEAIDSDSNSSGQLGSELELAIERWLDHELTTTEPPTYDELLLRLEGELLQYLMEHFENKPTRLAAAMNLHRGTLRQKLQRAGLQR